MIVIQLTGPDAAQALAELRSTAEYDRLNVQIAAYQMTAIAQYVPALEPQPLKKGRRR